MPGTRCTGARGRGGRKEQGPIKKDTNVATAGGRFQEGCENNQEVRGAGGTRMGVDTEYGNKHRLKEAAIGNRQAAIRGKPGVSGEDAH